MPQLPGQSQSQPTEWRSLRHDVPAVLRGSGGIHAPTAPGRLGHAGSHRPHARQPAARLYPGGSEYAAGCALSPSEEAILADVFDDPMSWERA